MEHEILIHIPSLDIVSNCSIQLNGTLLVKIFPLPSLLLFDSFPVNQVKIPIQVSVQEY